MYENKGESNTKKTFCILTAILLLLTAMIPVSAIEEVEPQAACEHEYRRTYTTRGYVCKDVEKHHFRVQQTYECTLCGHTYQKTIFADPIDHTKHYTNAWCDGTTQTHTLRCDICHTDFTETIRCPNAPHGSRPCVVLPFRQIFEVA